MQMGTPCIFQSRCPEHAKLVAVPKGGTIFMPDQRVSYIYHLHEGVVGLFSTTEDGYEVNTSLCIPPNFIGLIGFTGMYSDRQSFYHSEARALTPVVYCKIRREIVWDLLDDRPARAQIFEEVYNMIFLTSRLIAIPLRNDVEERVIVVLYALAESVAECRADGSLVISKISHEEIATMANTTRSTVTRLLRQLERQGLVNTGFRREIVIPDYSSLLAKSTLLAGALLYKG